MNFSKLYKKYYHDLYNYAFYLCKDRDFAKDLVSETFYKAMTIDSNLEMKTIKSYLIKIIYHLFIDSKRRNKTVSIDSEDMTLSEKNTRDAKDQSDHIDSLLSNLKEPDKSIFGMKIYGILTYEEISDITGLTIAALKIKIFRIRKKLMEEVKNEDL